MCEHHQPPPGPDPAAVPEVVKIYWAATSARNQKSLKHTPSKQISRKNPKCPDVISPEPATPLMHGLSHRLCLWTDGLPEPAVARLYSSASLAAAPAPSPAGCCLYSALPSSAWTAVRCCRSMHHPKSLTRAVHWPLPGPVGFAPRKFFALLAFLCLLPQSPRHSYLSCEQNTSLH